MKSCLIIISIIVFQFVPFEAFGDRINFSCPADKEGACLSSGDNICPSSQGKCVRNESICISPETCSDQGIICKSDFDDLNDNYEELREKSRVIASEYSDALDVYRKLFEKHEYLKDCVRQASSLEEAKTCYQVR